MFIRHLLKKRHGVMKPQEDLTTKVSASLSPCPFQCLNNGNMNRVSKGRKMEAMDGPKSPGLFLHKLI